MRFYTSVNRQGSVICHRYIEDGKRHSEIIKDYNYDLYIKSEYSKDAVGIHKEQLKKYEFETVVEMGEFVKSNGKHNVYGNTDPVAQFIAKEYPNAMALTNHYVTLNFDIEVVHASGKIKYKDYHELKVLLNDEEQLMSLGQYRKIDLSKNTALVYDIEKQQYLEFVDSCYAPLSIGFPDPNLALYEIMTISVISSLEDKIYVFGTKEFTGQLSIPNSKYSIVHIECGSEKELLIRFIQKWRDINPEIVTGYNVNGFDIPYLINRIVRVLGKKIASKLSPFSASVANCIKERQTDDAVLYQILGVTVYDYLELYKKFNRTKQESYKLDYIGEVEVGHSKVSFDEYDNSLMKLWEYDYNKFILYNAIDTLIVNKLDEKLKFISLAITIAHLTKSDLNDATGTVKIWDNLIYNLLLQKNIQVPPKTHNDEDVDIIGAYVKEPLYGRHGWVLTSDATSLYPMLIRMFNMSPETLVHREVGNSISTKDKRVIETLDDNLSYVDGMIRLQDEYGISEDIISFDVYDEDFDVDSLSVLSKRGLMKLKDHINNEIKFYGSGHEFIKGVDNVLDNIELTLNMQNDLSFAKELNVAVAGNGSTYDKSEIGVIPEGMTFLFDYRKSLKTEMNEKKKIIQSKIAELAELEAN